MTQDSLKKQIALLKKEGCSRVLYDCLQLYVGEVRGEEVRFDLPEVAEQIAQTLSARYKEQLPKKAVKWKQKTLQDEIDEIRKDKPFWDKLDRAYGRD